MADEISSDGATVSRRKYLKAGVATLSGIVFASGNATADQHTEAGGSGSNRLLITDGTVVTVDPQHGVLDRADILVEDGEISALGPDLDAGGADIIDASGSIVVPGFVNSHLHTWEAGVRGVAGDWSFLEYLEKMLGEISANYRPRDAYLGNLFGAVQQLNAGTTTILDWFHIANTPGHTDRAINGLEDAGIRAVFTHGPPGDDSAKWWDNSDVAHPDDIRRLARNTFPSDDGLLTLAMGIRGPDYSTDEVVAEDIETARELGIPASMHIGSLGGGGVQTLEELGLLGDDLNYVHANRLSDAEHALIGESGGSISTTPEVELQMGMGMPVFGKAIDNGAIPTIGVDVVSNVSDDMFTQARMALQVQRGIDNQDTVEAGRQIQSVSRPARRVLEAATIDGARALGLEDRIGSITPGKRADITVIDGGDLNTAPVHDPVETVVFQSGIENVETVIVDGHIHKRNGLVYNQTAQEHLDRLVASGRRMLRESDI
jgi:cytosine/adenosine deaminase-related metal-dependent hydrolase